MIAHLSVASLVAAAGFAGLSGTAETGADGDHFAGSAPFVTTVYGNTAPSERSAGRICVLARWTVRKNRKQARPHCGNLLQEEISGGAAAAGADGEDAHPGGESGGEIRGAGAGSCAETRSAGRGRNRPASYPPAADSAWRLRRAASRPTPCRPTRVRSRSARPAVRRRPFPDPIVNGNGAEAGPGVASLNGVTRTLNVPRVPVGTGMSARGAGPTGTLIICPVASTTKSSRCVVGAAPTPCSHSTVSSLARFAGARDRRLARQAGHGRRRAAVERIDGLDPVEVVDREAARPGGTGAADRREHDRRRDRWNGRGPGRGRARAARCCGSTRSAAGTAARRCCRC